MNGLDIVFLSIALVAVVFGLWKGFIRQVISLAGVIAGGVLALQYYGEVAQFLPFTDLNLRNAAAFLMILLACLLVSWIAVSLLSALTKVIGLSWANRLGGGLLGLAKATLLLTIVTLALVAFLPKENTILRTSRTVPVIIRFSEVLKEAIPDQLEVEFERKLKTLRQHWDRVLE